MKVNELYKIIRRNWVVKLTCFVLAIFIYFFYRTASLQSSTLVVPLKVSSQGNMVPAETVPSYVRVLLKGRPQDLARITNQNISTYLNLDYYTEPGEYAIPIQIQLAPEILGISPLQVTAENGTIEMTIAEKGRKQIPVKPDIQGSPAQGYEITNISINPSTVSVFGAVPLLESMGEVYTDEISVDERRTSFTQTVELIHDNQLVSYNAEPVSVSVTIQPITLTRRFVDQTIYLYGVNPLFIAQSEPDRVTFTLTGNQNQLEAFVPELHTVRIDCSNVKEPGVYDLPVEIVLPAGIRLVSQNPRTVKVALVPVSEDQVRLFETEIIEDEVDKEVVIEDVIVEEDAQEDVNPPGADEETSRSRVQ